MDCDTPVMLAMVAVGAMAITLELRMPCTCTLLTQLVPVHGGGEVGVQVVLAAFVAQQLQRIDGQNAAAPQRAGERRVRAAFLGELAGRVNGVVADGFHGLISELHSLHGAVGQPQLVERVLETHHAKTHRAVTSCWSCAPAAPSSS